MNNWIPCKDRLPDLPRNHFAQNYLASTSQGHVFECMWYNGWNTCYDSLTGGVDRTHEMTDIVAWMPMPKPYKVADNG